VADIHRLLLAGLSGRVWKQLCNWGEVWPKSAANGGSETRCCSATSSARPAQGGTARPGTSAFSHFFDEHKPRGQRWRTGLL